jgi:hypothetical protein
MNEKRKGKKRKEKKRVNFRIEPCRRANQHSSVPGRCDLGIITYKPDLNN